MLKRIFSPIRIGNMEIPNRLAVPAMVMNFCNPDGTATERYTAYHEAKARGGWGLIITEDYAVHPRGKGFPNIPGLWTDKQIESHKRFTERVHAAGKSKLFAQIYHAGRQTLSSVCGGRPVAPSILPCPVMREIPRELTAEEIRMIVRQFGDCALRAEKAGFDGIEIHGGHGYLIAQFMSPYSNKRTDAYGGGLSGRVRFPLEIIADVKAKAGKDFPVIFRISGDELVPGGRNIEDTKAIVMLLAEAGIDAVHVSAGVYESSYGIVPPAAVDHGWITDYAAEVKSVVDIPVITVGRINDPLLAESVLAGGKADIVAMGRASLADPDLPAKTVEGRLEDINHCIGCLQGCNSKITMLQPATCLVNPALGKERELRIMPASERKKVIIAGAGPAGMEAALVTAAGGHDVHLYEKLDRVGGQFRLAAVPPWKGEIAGFIRWQRRQLDKHGVHVHLETELTEEIVLREKPDAVVVATGSNPIMPNVPGIENVNVVAAQQVLEGRAAVGAKVAVIGGGMVGTETAHYLASLGKKVAVIEMLPAVARDESAQARHFLIKALSEKKVKIYVESTLTEIGGEGRLTIVRNGVTETVGPFETVIIAVGGASCNDLAARLEGKVARLTVVGDALKFRKALEAVAEGYRAGMEI